LFLEQPVERIRRGKGRAGIGREGAEGTMEDLEQDLNEPKFSREEDIKRTVQWRYK
jgi:hypothetical protein